MTEHNISISDTLYKKAQSIARQTDQEVDDVILARLKNALDGTFDVLSRAQLKFESGDFAGAVQDQRDAILSGESIDFFELWTYEAYEQVSFRRKIIEKNPNLIHAWRSQASIFGSFGRVKEAIFSFEKCLEVSPDINKVSIYIDYIQQCIRAGSYDRVAKGFWEFWNLTADLPPAAKRLRRSMLRSLTSIGDEEGAVMLKELAQDERLPIKVRSILDLTVRKIQEFSDMGDSLME